MKIKKNLQDISQKFKRGLEKYPLPIFLSLISGIFRIIVTDNRIFEINSQMDFQIRYLSQILFMGIFIFLAIDNLRDLEKEKDLGYLYISGLGFLIFYYFVNRQAAFDQTSIYYIRYFGGLLGAFLLSLVIRKNEKKDYSLYVTEAVENFVVAGVYTLVMLIGILFIVFTTQTLFDLNFNTYIYLDILNGVFFFYGIPFYISGLIDVDKEYGPMDFAKVYKSLINYLIIPLISIYTLILYVYLGKIVLTRVWPKGLVSNLVLWYSIFTLFILILIDSFEEDIPTRFRQVFSKLDIPILMMMFISIGIRINQYGITENRYFIVIGGIWVLLSMGYYSLNKERDLRVFPALLILSIVISSYGPISAFSLAKRSQNKRLEGILASNDMIEDGRLVASSKPDRESQYEISNIIDYFQNNHGLDEVAVLDEGTKIEDLDDILGFSYNPNNYYIEDMDYKYYSVSVDRRSEPLEIGAYDYLFELYSWENQNKDFEQLGLQVEYKSEGNSVTFKRSSGEDIEIGLEEEAKKLLERNFELATLRDYGEVPYGELLVDLEYDGLQVGILFSGIFFELDGDGEIQIESIEAMIMLGDVN